MKILVISLAGIGDSLIAGPLIKELRRNLPQAEIDVFVLWEQAKRLLENNPFISRVFQLNMIKEGYFRSLFFCLKLRKKNYDISINTHPQSKIQYRIITKIINAKNRLSHLYDNKSVFDKFLVNKAIEQDYSITSIDNNLNLLKLINLKPNYNLNYEVFLSKEDEKKAEEFYKKNRVKENKKIIGIHVGSGTTKNMKLKRWDLKNYVGLIRELLKENKNIKILLFGGPDEEAENKKIVRETKDKGVIIAKTDNIRETAAIMKKCFLFISVDNLLMHLASAVKVPKQIVIAGPTYDPAVEPKTKPIVIKSEIKCRPCYRYNGKGIKCNNKEFRKCLKDITPEIVYEKVKELLKEE